MACENCAISVVIRALGMIKKDTEKYLEQIPGSQTLPKWKNSTYRHCSYPKKALPM